MSDDITVRVLRNKQQIAQDVVMQLDHMSPVQAAYFGGSEPYYRYEVFSFAAVEFDQGDLLVDQDNIDPRTNANKQYRVISDPEHFPDMHWEMVADRVLGK